jgi:hypothetical protein
MYFTNQTLYVIAIRQWAEGNRELCIGEMHVEGIPTSFLLHDIF